MVYLLLAMGAFLKVRSKEGWTALMSACYNGHLNTAKVLIAAGLEVNATNKVAIYKYMKYSTTVSTMHE